MTKFERVRYEMFLRVRDFGDAHRDRFPEGSSGAQMFAKVAQATAQIEAEGLSRAQAVWSGRKTKADARATVVACMHDIARTARGIALTGAGTNEALKMPKRVSDVGLLAAARVFLEVGRPYGSAFVALGLRADWEPALIAAADAFEKGMHARRAGRSGVASAHTNIKTALADGFGAIHILDVIVVNALKDEPAMMAAWLRGRGIVEGKSKDDGEPSVEPVPQPAEPADGANEALKKAS